ncbi:hypothetical protein [Winogradskyella sp.]|jgi:hypothetical protein|uniref:hypothetical protein n=1 Tax=Winogradskyella sp. TaxID=1883156 RepID=UPI0025D3F519|nr:hypothetical protein [Winogradskyella sp.]MCT4630014.1 hypothetical protein [Winogradskyella sp.]
MKRILYFIPFIVTSCFLMPPGAPHYHKYQSTSNDVAVQVFCTPRSKVYHFYFNEYSKPTLCSKVFLEDNCFEIEQDSFFEQRKFLKSIRIGDAKFHRLFKEDTLKLISNNKSIELFPVD